MMTRLCQLVLVFVCISLLGGCAGQALYQDVEDTVTVVDGLQIYSEDAERTLVVVSSSKSTDKFCKSPPPDSVMSASDGISVGVSAAAGSDSLGDNASIGSTTLGGRSPDVLIVREIFYRVCEFSINHALDKPEATKLFTESLDAVVERLSRQD